MVDDAVVGDIVEVDLVVVGVVGVDFVEVGVVVIDLVEVGVMEGVNKDYLMNDLFRFGTYHRLDLGRRS